MREWFTKPPITICNCLLLAMLLLPEGTSKLKSFTVVDELHVDELHTHKFCCCLYFVERPESK